MRDSHRQRKTDMDTDREGVKQRRNRWKERKRDRLG